jgi:excisionase family DNA binding protein
VRYPLTLSIVEASALTGLSEYSIRKAIAAGEIPTIGSGRIKRIPRLPLLRMCGLEGADAAVDPASLDLADELGAARMRHPAKASAAANRGCRRRRSRA